MTTHPSTTVTPRASGTCVGCAREGRAALARVGGLGTRPIGHGLRRALSLLEVVLSLGILVTLSGMTYWFYAEAMRTRDRDVQAADKVRLARVLLDRMSSEIRQATIRTADTGVGIEGNKEEIRIASLRLPARELADNRFDRTEVPSPEYDLVTIAYRIARHPDILHPEEGYEYPLGLARVESHVPRPQQPSAEPVGEGAPAGEEESAGAFEEISVESIFGDAEGGLEGTGLETDIDWQELYSQEIRYLRFCYYDGKSWWDEWVVSGENPLPQLVLVTVGFEAHPPCGEEFGEDEDNVEFCECLNRDPPDCEPLRPDQFSTIVRVTAADALFRSRVSREGQALVEEAAQSQEEEASEP